MSKVLYLECNMGAAGDMLMGALLELHPDPKGFLERLNTINIPKVRVEAQKTKKCGITGTHIHVLVDGAEEDEHMHDDHIHNSHTHDKSNHKLHQHHSGMRDISDTISGLSVSDGVKENASAVYRLIAEAESHVHDTEIENIHFHEVGTMDAVTDVVGVCMLMEELDCDRVICSSVNVGSGTVKCAHGILPVPAPATAYILRGIPIYSGEVKSELCTPTGAALIKHFVSEFSGTPVLRILKIGYGMGKKDFDTANCVRAVIGEAQENSGEVTELRCNIDDMTGEQIGFALERIMEGGALDVFYEAVGMKKNRPGILLTCLCGAEDKERIIGLIFKYTSTIGIREYIIKRHVLERKNITLDTAYGTVNAKESSGFGVRRVKAEYEDLAKIAKENNIAVGEVL